jgi:uncharacterized protein YndB with AHSA1/START domain
MATAQPQPRRVRKRILIPSILLALMLLAAGWLWWRGTMAETAPRDPATAADGPVTQLLTQDGRTFVRSAIVVAAPPEEVWRVVTDYDSHPKFMPYIAELAQQKLDDGRVRLTGVARTHVWADWPFEIDVTEKADRAKGEYSATWHEENKTDFAVNRGGWTVRPHGAKQTLVVFTKQAELSGYPNFLIRNIMMNRVGELLSAVRDEVARRGL